MISPLQDFRSKEQAKKNEKKKILKVASFLCAEKMSLGHFLVVRKFMIQHILTKYYLETDVRLS